MEMELNTIIEKIKQEGVGQAKEDAGAIISDAKKEAEKIIKEANDKKESIIKQATEEAEKLKKNSEEAIKQAARDVLLGLRDSIIKLFDGVVKRQVESNLTQDVTKNMLIKLVENMGKDGSVDLDVLLSDEDKTALEESLLSALQQEAKKGVTLKVSSHIDHGFRVGEKDGNAYYDFTDQAIAEAFTNYLNPKISSLLK